MRIGRRAVFLATAIAVAVSPANLESCGPFLPSAVFTLKLGPVDPRAEFAKGNLGVLMPDFNTRLLVTAYRYLSGLTLEPSEIDEIFPGKKNAEPARPDDPVDGVDLWLKTRNALVKPAIERVETVHSSQVNGVYEAHDNCLQDSFRTAAATLTDRAKQWGPSSAALRDWLAAQDVVFSNCAEAKDMPAGAPPGAPALLRADRDYQMAAAAFYQGHWDDARQRFAKIAQDSASPWRKLAPYLAVRAQIRKGSVDGNSEALVEAERLLREIRADPAHKDEQEALDRLINFVEARTQPVKRLDEISAHLTATRLSKGAGQDLTDFIYLFWNKERSAPREDLGKNELTEWLLVWRSRNEEQAKHALERWRARRSLPWLVAALCMQQTFADDAARPELLAAAERIDASSPGFASVAFYSAKIVENGGDAPAARAWLDRGLNQKLPVSDRNLFRAERMSLAQNWDEFLKLAPRDPRFVDYSLDQPEDAGNFLKSTPFASRGPAFDSDSERIWDQAVPLARWLSATEGSELPPNLRGRLARSGWMRALLLDRPGEAHKFMALWKQLDEAGAKSAAVYQDASGAPRERFAAILTMLRNPGLAPFVETGFGRAEPLKERDMFRNNWWCRQEPKENPAAPAEAPFLPAADRELGRSEWARMSQGVVLASVYLPGEVLKWAKAHPEDPDAPEALALAIDVAHYTYCSDPRVGPLSKQCFTLLKTRYPDTKWARQTKYWYQ